MRAIVPTVLLMPQNIATGIQTHHLLSLLSSQVHHFELFAGSIMKLRAMAHISDTKHKNPISY